MTRRPPCSEEIRGVKRCGNGNPCFGLWTGSGLFFGKKGACAWLLLGIWQGREFFFGRCLQHSDFYEFPPSLTGILRAGDTLRSCSPQMWSFEQINCFISQLKNRWARELRSSGRTWARTEFSILYVSDDTVLLTSELGGDVSDDSPLNFALITPSSQSWMFTACRCPSPPPAAMWGMTVLFLSVLETRSISLYSSPVIC